jgi:hypothetical protein
MENELSVIIIGSVPFIINNEKQELIRFDHHDRTIPFGKLHHKDGYYALKFDTLEFRPAIDMRKFGDLEDRFLDVKIPQQIIESPQAILAPVRDDLNLHSQKNNWGFYIGDEKTALRLSGVLPHIDLAGTDFTVDWRLKELRETELPWNNISLAGMEMSDSGEEYLCFYNIETHELFEPDEKLLEIPENVVVLEIPYEIKLDPVAVARESGFADTELLMTHPIHDKLSAKVTPLSESGLPEFIANNIGNAEDPGHGLGDDNKQSRRHGR